MQYPPPEGRAEMAKKPTETQIELRAPKQIPILQVGAVSCGVSLHMQQDYAGSYQMWRFMWSACGFGWRVGGILYPRGDLVGKPR